jgi:hypothetical protein
MNKKQMLIDDFKALNKPLTEAQLKALGLITSVLDTLKKTTEQQYTLKYQALLVAATVALVGYDHYSGHDDNYEDSNMMFLIKCMIIIPPVSKIFEFGRRNYSSLVSFFGSTPNVGAL